MSKYIFESYMYKVTAIAGCFRGTYHRCTFSAPFWHPLRFDFFFGLSQSRTKRSITMPARHCKNFASYKNKVLYENFLIFWTQSIQPFRRNCPDCWGIQLSNTYLVLYDIMMYYCNMCLHNYTFPLHPCLTTCGLGMGGKSNLACVTS